MEEFNKLLNDFVFGDNPVNIKIFLKGIEQYKTFGSGDSTGLQQILTYLRTHTDLACMNDVRPLLVMKLFIAQCSSQVFAENCAHWTLNLINIVRHNQNENIISLAAEILTDLLPFVTQNTDLSRQFSASSLATLVTSLVEQHTVCALKCLEQCMICFRGPCRQQRVEIEKCILRSLSSPDADIVKVAGNLLVLLTGLGGGGEHGAYHATSWLDYCHQILVSLHSTMRVLFAKVEANQDVIWQPARRTKLGLPPIEEKRPLTRVHFATSRFEALCHCLAQMISTPFPAVINIPIGDILGLICRVAAVKPDVLLKRKKRTPDDLVLLALLPGLHAVVLKLLRALIMSCRRNLLPHSTTVSKVLLQYLQWTKSLAQNGKLSEKPLCDIRMKAYEVLQVWTQTMITSSTLDKFHNQLVEHLLADIWNPIETVKLQGITAEDKNPERPPKKRKVDAARNVTSSLFLGICKDDRVANSKLCSCAIRAFRMYVYAMGPLIHAASYVSVCRAVIHLVRDIQQQFLHLPSPYDDPVCRRELYSLLLALTVTSPPTAKLPTSIAGKFFSRGLQDPDLLVSSLCLEAEAITAALIHPNIPSLELPTSTVPVTNNTDASALSLAINQSFWSAEEPSDIPLTLEKRPTDDEISAVVEENCNNIDIDSADNQNLTKESEDLHNSYNEMHSPSDKAVSPLRPESAKQEDSIEVVLNSDDDTQPMTAKEVDSATVKETVCSRSSSEELSLSPKPETRKSTSYPNAEAGPSGVQSCSSGKTITLNDKEDDAVDENLDDMLQTFDDRDSDA